jgi:hypothetical protein
MADMQDVPQERLGLRKLRSANNRAVLAALKRVADANGVPQAGRFIQYGTPEAKNAVVLGAAAGHSGEADYQAAFPNETEGATKS